MSTRKDKQHRWRQRREMAQQNKTKPPSKIIRLFVFLGGLLGAVTAALSLLPRMTVEPSAPVDKYNLFSSSFTVTNTNFVPLEHVDVLLGIGELEFGSHPSIVGSKTPETNPAFDNAVANPKWIHHTLSMDEKLTITLSDMFGADFGQNLTGGDIAVIIRYHPWILPFEREKILRFRVHRELDGGFTWYSSPVDR
jgi:hypothetical protein